MNKRKISIMLATVFLFQNSVMASEIQSSSQSDGESVTVSGKITDVTKSHEVTILVGENDNILYIDQESTAEDGSFRFDFGMPIGTEHGSYSYKLGSNANTGVYQGIIDFYEPPVIVQNEFLTADLNIGIVNYVPIIEGTLSCDEEKTISIVINNLTDGIVIDNRTITQQDGECIISYQLPSLLSAKEYSVSINCTDGAKELVAMNIDIDSSILLVDISGSATAAEGITINAQAESTNTDFVNESTSFTGNKSLAFTIPNIFANTMYHLGVQGYEEMEIYPTETVLTSILQISESDYITKVYVTAKSDKFSDKVFKVTYPADKLNLQDACCFTKEQNINIGEIKGSNVRIFKISDGEIWFTTDYDPIYPTKVSGLINGLTFERIETGEAKVTCEMSEIE